MPFIPKCVVSFARQRNSLSLAHLARSRIQPALNFSPLCRCRRQPLTIKFSTFLLLFYLPTYLLNDSVSFSLSSDNLTRIYLQLIGIKMNAIPCVIFKMIHWLRRNTTVRWLAWIKPNLSFLYPYCTLK